MLDTRIITQDSDWTPTLLLLGENQESLYYPGMSGRQEISSEPWACGENWVMVTTKNRMSKLQCKS